jgi:hypothetical protein
MKNQKRQSKQNFNIDILSIIANGGATLDRNGASVNFKNGYQVSRKDCYTLSAEKLNDIKKAVKKVLNRISHENGLYCGIWVENGLVYIDISERIKSLKKALRVGKARKQISIFNWACGDCVYC